MKAKIQFFDRLRGEGMIQVETGKFMTLYACNIKGKKTWYPQTACVYFNKGDEIDVEIDDDSGLVVCSTQGTFDAEKWAELDQNRLAFKCNEDGEAINGLLPKGTMFEE